VAKQKSHRRFTIALGRAPIAEQAPGEGVVRWRPAQHGIDHHRDSGTVSLESDDCPTGTARQLLERQSHMVAAFGLLDEILDGAPWLVLLACTDIDQLAAGRGAFSSSQRSTSTSR
jgi:hypothetical protein